METKAVIDRIVDGRLAVLLVGDEETEHVVPLDCLPAGAEPGVWLSVRLEDGELIDATVDQEETERTKQRVQEKLERLRQRGRRFQPRE